MRVALLADESFALREHAMLARLEVGLADEGARVVRAVPSRVVDMSPAGLATPVVGYEPRGLAWTRRARAGRLGERLAAALGFEAEPGEGWLDVVHALGTEAWPVALELARLCGAGLALEVFDAAGLRAARDLARTDLPARVVLNAADDALAAALHTTRAPAEVNLAAWGVHVPESERPPIDARGPVAVAVLCTGAEPRGVHAMLEGLAAVCADGTDLMLFVDAQAGRRAGVWPRARALGLLDRVSLVGNLEGYREPVLHVDVLVQPEAVGSHHSLMLDAMAGGVAVVARRDAMVSALIDGVTARLVGAPTPQGWADAVRGLVSDPAGGAALAASARDWIRRHRTASGQVAAVLGAYARLSPAPARA
ncbi:MAG TPA: glycosyltransferase [Phycisphaerales bacterium]|nr:glycosyltransferase [Phycisphaerales bacterium]